MSATLAELLAAAAGRTKDVEVRGIPVRIRELTIAGREAFLDAHQHGPARAVIAVVRHGVVDTLGRPLFDETSLAQLEECSADFLQELSRQVLELSGLGTSSGNE